MRHGQAGVVLTKGGDVHRGTTQVQVMLRNMSQQGKTIKKKLKLTLGRGQCSGCWGNTVRARGGRVSDTWKRVSAREKKTMQIEKKELTWRAGR